METITIILPTYRRKTQLLQAIKSALNQSYPHLRLYILDNASADGTKEMVIELEQKDPRIDYFCHETNIGAIENFQYGLKAVTTRFFCFLADDDQLLPDFLLTALNSFKKYPQASFFVGTVVDINEQGKVLRQELKKWPSREYYEPTEGIFPMINHYPNWTGTLFRKEVIEKVGYLDPQIKAIDLDYMIRAAACCSFIVNKQPCAQFTQHTNSYSGKYPLKILWPGWQLMSEKMATNPHLPVTLQKAVSRRLLQQLHELLFRSGGKFLLHQDDAQALLCSHYLRDSDKKLRADLLKVAVYIFKTFPRSRKTITLFLHLFRSFSSTSQ